MSVFPDRVISLRLFSDIVVSLSLFLDSLVSLIVLPDSVAILSITTLNFTGLIDYAVSLPSKIPDSDAILHIFPDIVLLSVLPVHWLS